MPNSDVRCTEGGFDWDTKTDVCKLAVAVKNTGSQCLVNGDGLSKNLDRDWGRSTEVQVRLYLRCDLQYGDESRRKEPVMSTVGPPSRRLVTPDK